MRLAGRAGLTGPKFDGVVDRSAVVMLFNSLRFAVLSGDEIGGRALFQSRFRYAALRSPTLSRARRFFMKNAPEPTMAIAQTIPKTMRTMLVVPIPFLGGGGGGAALCDGVGAVETPGVLEADEVEEVVVADDFVDVADTDVAEVEGEGEGEALPIVPQEVDPADFHSVNVE